MNLSRLLQHVEYYATNEQQRTGLVPLGKRSFSIRTQVSCDDTRVIPLGVHHVNVEIVKAELRRLSISGQTLINVDRKSLKTGSEMLPSIQIIVTQNIGSQSFALQNHLSSNF